MNIVFLHIPKTGGTSLNGLLGQALVNSGRIAIHQICPHNGRGISGIPHSELRNYAFFSGHYFFNQLENLPRPQQTFTLLRDPRARLISAYNYYRSVTWATVHEMEARGQDSPRKAKELSFTEWMKCPGRDARVAADNVMARHLAGLEATRADGSWCWRDQSIIQRSLENLMSLTLFGFLEHSGEFLRRLGRALEVWLPDELPVMNDFYSLRAIPLYEEVEPLSIDAVCEAEIQKCTRLDAEIYRLAALESKSFRARSPGSISSAGVPVCY